MQAPLVCPAGRVDEPASYGPWLRDRGGRLSAFTGFALAFAIVGGVTFGLTVWIRTKNPQRRSCSSLT